MTKKRRGFWGQYSQKDNQLSKVDYDNIDVQFLELVKARQYKAALMLAEEVQDINVTDPMTCSTFLHFAAKRSAEKFLRKLTEIRGDIDFHALNKQGRRASEIAWHDALNEPLGAWLMEREKLQATKSNIPAWPPEPNQ